MSHPPELLLFGLSCLIAGTLLYRFIGHYFRKVVLRARFRRGAEGEREAQRYLRSRGFRIVEQQARRKMHMVVDGKETAFEIRADFIARKKGKRCVVEVKTGSCATNPAFTDTRRQLLEYRICYGADILYLFDADRGKLQEIRLPGVKSDGCPRVSFVAGVVLGIGVTITVTIFLTTKW